MKRGTQCPVWNNNSLLTFTTRNPRERPSVPRQLKGTDSGETWWFLSFLTGFPKSWKYVFQLNKLNGKSLATQSGSESPFLRSEMQMRCLVQASKNIAHSTSLQPKLSKVAVAISNATFGILDLILTITMLAKVRTNGTKQARCKACKVNQARSTYPGLAQTPTCACLLSFTHFFGSESKKDQTVMLVTAVWTCCWVSYSSQISVPSLQGLDLSHFLGGGVALSFSTEHVSRLQPGLKIPVVGNN